MEEQKNPSGAEKIGGDRMDEVSGGSRLVDRVQDRAGSRTACTCCGGIGAAEAYKGTSFTELLGPDTVTWPVCSGSGIRPKAIIM